MEWIRVEDRLPEQGTPVLTVSEDLGSSPVVAFIRREESYSLRFYIAYTFHGERDIGFHFQTFPTHWMPLPEPPKTKG